GAQFAARFDLLIEPATVELCRAIDLSDLPRERVWGEIEKLLLVAPRPSLGLAALRRLDVPRKLFPELDELDDAAWDETALATDSARQRLDDEPAIPRADRIAVMLAVLARRLDVERADALFERLNIH